MNEKDNNAHLRMLLLNDNNARLQMLLWNKGHVILVPINLVDYLCRLFIQSTLKQPLTPFSYT